MKTLFTFIINLSFVVLDALYSSNSADTTLPTRNITKLTKNLNLQVETKYISRQSALLFMFCLPETLILLYILFSFLMGDIICLLSALMLDEVNTHYLFTKHPLIMSASTRIDDFSSGKYLIS